jgi:hypothetical protein
MARNNWGWLAHFSRAYGLWSRSNHSVGSTPSTELSVVDARTGVVSILLACGRRGAVAEIAPIGGLLRFCVLPSAASPDGNRGKRAYWSSAGDCGLARGDISSSV